jgi:hypothetical protein
VIITQCTPELIKATIAAATSGGTVILNKPKSHNKTTTIPAAPPLEAAAVDWFAGLLEINGAPVASFVAIGAADTGVPLIFVFLSLTPTS